MLDSVSVTEVVFCCGDGVVVLLPMTLLSVVFEVLTSIIEVDVGTLSLMPLASPLERSPLRL